MLLSFSRQMEIASSGAAVGVKDSCHQRVRYADEAHSSDRVAAVNRTDFRIDGPPSQDESEMIHSPTRTPPPFPRPTSRKAQANYEGTRRVT